MLTHKNTPTVVIANFAEAHLAFLSRSDNPSERDALIQGEDFHGDRTILWEGDPKLVIVSYPIAHAAFNTSRLNYPQTRYLASENPTHYLCEDILREEHLIRGIVNYTGADRRLRLIPYATTPQFLALADALRANWDLQVVTPESPAPENLWLRDYIDTKTGYRSLASHWLPDSEKFIPFGIVTPDLHRAARAAYWFLNRGEACVVKADTGESGIGTTILTPGQISTIPDIVSRLQPDPFYADEEIIVERYIQSTKRFSPSVELKVPVPGDGTPSITYVSNQLFLGFGDFCGIQIDRSLYREPWYPDLERCSLLLANKLQEMGYVGHFDLDCIVSDSNEIYLLEINARRTGGTHVHEFAKHCFGDDYVDRVSLLSFEAADSGSISNADELLKALGDMLYPMPGESPRGVVITITTSLVRRRFGYIVLAPEMSEVLDLKKKLEERIRAASSSR